MTSIPKKGGWEVHHVHPSKKSRMGRCGPNPVFLALPFLKTPIFKIASQSLALPRGHFMRGHWPNASMPIVLGKIDFRSSFYSFTTFSGVLLQIRQNSDKHSDKLQTKLQTKFRQNSDTIQTKNQTKFRHISDNKIQTKFRQQNSDKFQRKNQTNFRPKFRQNSDNKIQTEFRQQNSDKFQTTKFGQKSDNKLQTKLNQKFRQHNSDKIQTNSDKTSDKSQTKFRQIFGQHSDKIQTNIHTKLRQNSDKNSEKNSDKIQTNIQTTKFRQNSDNRIQTKFRQQNSDQNSDQISDQISDKDSDRIQTEIRVKFRHKSDRIPGLGIFGCSGSFEKVLFILKMKLQNAFCCFQKKLKFTLPQKESGKRSLAKKWRKKWQKHQKKWPKSDRKRPENEKKWSNSFCRTPFAAPWEIVIPLFLRTPLLILRVFWGSILLFYKDSHWTSSEKAPQHSLVNQWGWQICPPYHWRQNYRIWVYHQNNTIL